MIALVYLTTMIFGSVLSTLNFVLFVFGSLNLRTRMILGCLIFLAFDPSFLLRNRTQKNSFPTSYISFERNGANEIVIRENSEGNFYIDPYFETKEKTNPEDYGMKIQNSVQYELPWIPLNNKEINIPFSARNKLLMMTFKWESNKKYPILPGEVLKTITFHEKNHRCMIAPTSRNFFIETNKTIKEIPAFDQQSFWIHCRSVFASLPVLSVSGETESGHVAFYL